MKSSTSSSVFSLLGPAVAVAVADFILLELPLLRRLLSWTGALLLFLGLDRLSANVDSTAGLSDRVRTGLSTRTRVGLLSRGVRGGLVLAWRLCLDLSFRDGLEGLFVKVSFRSVQLAAGRDDERSVRLVVGAFTAFDTGSASCGFFATLLVGDTDDRVLPRWDFVRGADTVLGSSVSVDVCRAVKSMDGMSMIDDSERDLRISGFSWRDFVGLLLLVLRLFESFSSCRGLFLDRSSSSASRPLDFLVGLRGVTSRLLLLLLLLGLLDEDRELFDVHLDEDLNLQLGVLTTADGLVVFRVLSLGVLSGVSRLSHHGSVPPSSLHTTKLSINFA
jgi:hypothetical protein